MKMSAQLHASAALPGEVALDTQSIGGCFGLRVVQSLTHPYTNRAIPTPNNKCVTEVA
jgi:hypothetical protein